MSGNHATNDLPKPPWIRVKAPGFPQAYGETRTVLRELRLATVCEEAACPNIGECWAQGHATFMIMGATCTRACAFCNVATGLPGALDSSEPDRVAEAVKKLDLSHVVITSVDRDDLPDGGASHFAHVIGAIRRAVPAVTIEVLTPDFRGKKGALSQLFAEPPDVFNHNIETVPRLYPTIRPGARYFTSLALLQEARCLTNHVFTKSGLMVGLGEEDREVMQVMDDLRAANVDFLTIGQYLRPSRRHAPVARFVEPKTFEVYAKWARGKGFSMVSASPFTRSSYHAAEDFSRLRLAHNVKH